jgi:hypothetical protein
LGAGPKEHARHETAILVPANCLDFSSIWIVSPVLAQCRCPTSSADRVGADGHAHHHSTPRKVQYVGDQQSGRCQKCPANNANYPVQQQRYQSLLQQNQAQQERHRDHTAADDNLRTHNAADRATYHHSIWSDCDVTWASVEQVVNLIGANLVGERAQPSSVSRVGALIETADVTNENVEGLLVRLDNDKLVRIDPTIGHYERADGIVMTNLEASDLHHWADERLWPLASLASG